MKDPSLEAQLADKKLQIVMFLAKRDGIVIENLASDDTLRLQKMTDQLLNEWAEADAAGDPAAKGDSPFNKLAREFHEIQKQIDAESSS